MANEPRLPKNLNFQTKVQSVEAKSYKANIQPQTGSIFNLGDTITINIPTRNNLVLVPTESYLKFTHTLTNATGAPLDARWDVNGSHGLIQRIRIYHGSNLLQDIDNYGLLAKLLFETQVPADAATGKYNITTGTRSDMKLQGQANATNALVVAGADLAGAITSINTGVNLLLNNAKILTVNTGDSIASQLADAGVVSNTYCLNLISLLGSLCSQHYIPLFEMTSAPLRLELQLVSSPYQCLALTASNGVTCVLKNVEYIANMIELSDMAIGMIKQSLGGQPLQFVVPDYKNYNYTTTLAGGSNTQINMPIPAKFSSLKSIHVVARDNAKIIDSYFPFSSCKFGLSEYWFRIGSNSIPATHPSTIPEFFSELVKSVGSLSDLTYQPSIDMNSYSQDLPLANTRYGQVNSGSFFIGLDCENYSNSAKDQIYAGMNTSTDDIYFIGNYLTAANTNIRMDAYALIDQLWLFENGTCYVKF